MGGASWERRFLWEGLCGNQASFLAWFSEGHGVFKTRELRIASHDVIIPRFDVNLLECANSPFLT